MITKATTAINKLKVKNEQISKELDELNIELADVKQQIKNFEVTSEALSPENIVQTLDYLRNRSKLISDKYDKKNSILKQINNDIGSVQKIIDRITNMKVGSIALLNQVTTISKLRLIDPVSRESVLSNIVLSNQTMDEIDKQLKNIL